MGETHGRGHGTQPGLHTPREALLVHVTQAAICTISLIHERSYHHQQVLGATQGVHAVAFNHPTNAGHVPQELGDQRASPLHLVLGILTRWGGSTAQLGFQSLWFVSSESSISPSWEQSQQTQAPSLTSTLR